MINFWHFQEAFMKRTILLTAFFALIFLTSCGKRNDTHGIVLTVKITPKTVTDLLYVKMDYEFKISDDFTPLKKDYKTFVHLWRKKSKEMLLQDDHLPEIKTSTWKKGDTIRYSRVIFIPQFINEFDNIDFEGYEEVKLTVGLYDPNPGAKDSFNLYEKSINVQPASYNAPEIAYYEGWNELETDPAIADPFMRTWRWTTGKAVCIIENPHKNATFIIKGGVNQAKKVILKINDTVLEEIVPETDKFSREYTLTPQMMGDGDEFSLKIETDKTFIPSRVNAASKDNRELGVQIYFIYFREKVQ
jgi:hypothetical protein